MPADKPTALSRIKLISTAFVWRDCWQTHTEWNWELVVLKHRVASWFSLRTIGYKAIDPTVGKLGHLQWRHKEGDGVSYHQPRDCLLKCLFRRRPKKTSKLSVTGLCEGNSPVTGDFPAQRTDNAENVSIWWRHHTFYYTWRCSTLKTVATLNGNPGTGNHHVIIVAVSCLGWRVANRAQEPHPFQCYPSYTQDSTLFHAAMRMGAQFCLWVTLRKSW